MKPIIGIISGLPSQEPDRTQRFERVKRLISQLKDIMPDIPITILAQNGRDLQLIDTTNITFHSTIERLGILKARKELRKILLSTSADYFILFDDDAIIQSTPELIAQYLKLMAAHPHGWAFVREPGVHTYNPYAPSQLNLCAISRYIFEKEDFPSLDPERSEAFEDRIYTMTLYCKYPELEFLIPEGLKCIHFKNTNEIAPSTGSKRRQYSWKQMRRNTEKIEIELLKRYNRE